jgi:hypothetical protein
VHESGAREHREGAPLHGLALSLSGPPLPSALFNHGPPILGCRPAAPKKSVAFVSFVSTVSFWAAMLECGIPLARQTRNQTGPPWPPRL